MFDTELIIALTFICLIIVGLWILVRMITKATKGYSNISTEIEDQLQQETELDLEPEITMFHAVVVDMACAAELVGHRVPRAVQNYYVKFRDDQDRIIDIPLTEELYEGFEIGLSGTVTLSGGFFYGFEPDNIE
jgi:hypothetical protein